MLSRTADNLFWMARYMERAENTARMLDVNYQTSLLPQSADAAEAEKVKADAARKDAAEKAEKEKGETAEVAADKAKKDAAKKDCSGEAKKDGEGEAKKDGVKAVENEDPDGDGKPGDGKVTTKDSARSDSASVAQLDELRRELAILKARTAPVPETDRAAFADEQARADAVYMGLGNRAPAPMTGETVLAYRTRLLRGVQKHSPDWKQIDLIRVSPDVLDVAQSKIYADAQIAARNPDDVPAGTLREINKVDPATGQRMTTFVGKGTFISGMKRTSRRVSGFNTKFGA